MRWMPSGLPALSSLRRSFGSLTRTGPPVLVVLIADAAGAADDLLRRHAVDALRIDAHEILAAAGHDEGLEAIGAQEGEKLDLRQVGQVGKGPLPARVASRVEPGRDFAAEGLDIHAGQRRADDLEEVVHREFGDGLAVAGEHGPERLDLGELRLRLHNSGHAIEAIDDLRVDRMLDPQRAVLVEGRDALFRRHEFRARRIGRLLHEAEDRLPRGPVVPGGQGVDPSGAGLSGETDRGGGAQHERGELAAMQLHKAPPFSSHFARVAPSAEGAKRRITPCP